jgi:hypothetical protein
VVFEARFVENDIVGCGRKLDGEKQQERERDTSTDAMSSRKHSVSPDWERLVRWKFDRDNTASSA